jgi:hypothetical protein
MVGRSCAVFLALALAAGTMTPELSLGPVAGALEERVSAPKVKNDLIPYPKKRKRQMARYSKRHYGKRKWILSDPPVIVLHLTSGSSYRSAWNHFASNAPNRGELPGVCAHFIVGKRGTIYRVVPTKIRCRHAIGLNHKSIGIEMVQEIGSGSHWAAKQVLKRRPQIRAALRLTAHLKDRFGIRLRNVIGHAMANDSPFFKDRQGWRNDHTDWLARDVRRFRTRLRRFVSAPTHMVGPATKQSSAT